MSKVVKINPKRTSTNWLDYITDSLLQYPDAALTLSMKFNSLTSLPYTQIHITTTTLICIWLACKWEYFGQLDQRSFNSLICVMGNIMSCNVVVTVWSSPLTTDNPEEKKKILMLLWLAASAELNSQLQTDAKGDWCVATCCAANTVKSPLMHGE